MTVIIEQQLVKLAADFRKMRTDWQASKAHMRPLIKALEAIPEVSFRLTDTLDVSFSGSRDTLVTAIRALRTRGFETHNSPPEAGQSYFSAFYHHPDIPLRVWISFSSTVCRRVQVGTELKEVPVYELRCDEPPSIEVPTEDGAALN